jgi:hypothetical protein
MVDFVNGLLEEVEGKYDADVAARLLPLEVVDRLTGNLRLAHARLAEWPDGSADVVSALFKDHLTALLDSRVEQSFGRHLGISFHELYMSETNEASRKAS